jgi:hypothetical protein
MVPLAAIGIVTPVSANSWNVAVVGWSITV